MVDEWVDGQLSTCSDRWIEMYKWVNGLVR